MVKKKRYRVKCRNCKKYFYCNGICHGKPFLERRECVCDTCYGRKTGPCGTEEDLIFEWIREKGDPEN